jgi:hypothetical protein
MPFYKIAEMQQNPSTANPQQFVQTAVGEFMKAGIVTKPKDEGPRRSTCIPARSSSLSSLTASSASSWATKSASRQLRKGEGRALQRSQRQLVGDHQRTSIDNHWMRWPRGDA